MDSDAQAIINAMSPTPSSARQTAINDLVVALKNAGVWSQLDFLHVYAAHSEASALINWVDPGTHDATAVNAPTFTADEGFTGNGSTSYLNTNYVPSTHSVNYAQNDASFGVWSQTELASSNQMSGGRDSTNELLLDIRRANDSVLTRINDDGGGSHGTNTTSVGMFALRRVGSSDRTFWRNGVLLLTNSRGSSGLPTVSLFTLAANDNGSASFFDTRQYSMAFAAAGMTAGEQLAFYNALEAYLDALDEPPGGDEDINVSDTGSGADATAIVVGAGVSDTGSGADSPAGEASIPTDDTASGMDAVDLAALASVIDSATGSDSNVVTVTLSVADSGSGADDVDILAAFLKLVSDSASATDALGAMSVALDLPDAATGTDAPTLQVTFSVSDTASGVDDTMVALLKAVSDTASSSDALAVSVAIPITDSATIAEVTQQLVTTLVQDTAMATEVATAIDPASRIFRVSFLLRTRSAGFALTSRTMRFHMQASRSMTFHLED